VAIDDEVAATKDDDNVGTLTGRVP